jgi:FlaA1/EpsC-like NDP-sugar epimerase
VMGCRTNEKNQLFIGLSMIQFLSLFANRALALPRFFKRAFALSVDICSCILSVWLAYYLRLGEFVGLEYPIYWPILLSIVLAIPIFITSGLYRAIFRYNGLPAMMALMRAILLYSVLFSAIFTFYGVDGVPRTVGLIQPLLLLVLIGASRAAVRVWLGSLYQNQVKRSSLPQALIYGAGTAGRQLASAMANSHEIRVVGFLDDETQLHGDVLNGLTIYNPADMVEILAVKNITDVLLALPSVSRHRRNEILSELSPHKLAVRTLPGLSDLAMGRISLSDVKELDVDDLLGRESVKPNVLLLNLNTHHKTVMVTGAGGSIGSELCRQILKASPRRLLLVEMSEFALYQIHQELQLMLNSDALEQLHNKTDIEILPLLGSVCDPDRMSEIMGAWKPQTVYHAAAYKHVPMVEHNVVEGVRNNVWGTIVCAKAAIKYGVENFVLISTDKAVRPTNMMGATKRLAEMVLQSLANHQSVKHIGHLQSQTDQTCFSMVRFGNVLGSSGSVVPLFREQIKNGGPITLTHLEITRYFMTIPEAAQLVLQAGAMGVGGDVFVLDMGQPVRIYDLAKHIVELSGLTLKTESNLDGDIEIKVTGLRPGEKLYEELLIGDNPSPTEHFQIMKAHEMFIDWFELEQKLEILGIALKTSDIIQARVLMQDLIPGYIPDDRVVDWIYKVRKQ